MDCIRIRTVALVLSAIVSPLLLTAHPSPTRAQQSPDLRRVRVYLDCQSNNCDSREFRTEITFVDWVNERTEADVHVLMTGQDAGTGDQYVLDFIGQGEFSESGTRLEHLQHDTDTRDETLSALTALLKAGLVGYVARRGYADRLEIDALEMDAGSASTMVAVENDPWKLWVFGIGGEFSADGEERQNSFEIGFEVSANRTTADWKLDAQLEFEIERREFELNSGQIFLDRSDDWEASVLLVRSVTDHISIGSEMAGNSSTNRNRDYGGRIATAVEWSLYPYAEANRRQLVIHHQLGVTGVRYEEVTIFERLDETFTDQRIGVAYDTRQPWGSISMNAQWSNLLADWSKYSLSLGGGLNFRVLRGLDLRVFGGYELLRDQIYLPAEGASDEEILVQRRQLATGYEYDFGVGLRFRFGSIYNNVVNNRFPGSARGRSF